MSPAVLSLPKLVQAQPWLLQGAGSVFAPHFMHTMHGMRGNLSSWVGAACLAVLPLKNLSPGPGECGDVW